MAVATFVTNFIINKDFLYQLTATLIIFIVIRILIFYKSRYKRYQLLKYYGIPGPKPNLNGGNLAMFENEQAFYKIDFQLRKTYGKTFGFYIGDEAILVTTDLEYLKKVFLERMNSFKERQKEFLRTPLSASILFAPYNRWKVMRKVMSPPFSSYQMRGLEPVQFLEDSIKMMIDYIENKVESSKLNDGDGKGKIELDIQDLMKATALYMISNMAIKLPNVQVRENEPNVKSLDSFLSVIDKGAIRLAIRFPFINFFLSQFAKYFEYDKTIALIHKGLNKTINDEMRRMNSNESSPREGQTNKTKLIDVLIRLHYEGKLTREEVISNADAILFAGYDTTSTTLAYIFWVVSKYPDIQERLRQDLLTYGTESEYLEQVMNETMRLYPTVTVFTSRVATETVELDGLTIPQGVKVTFNGFLVHRDPNVWPDPMRFDPERFKPGTEIHPCAFAPFGLGERKCLGNQLAKLEMKMVICDVLLRYRVRLISPENLELVSYANILTKSREKIIIELKKL